MVRSCWSGTTVACQPPLLARQKKAFFLPIGFQDWKAGHLVCTKVLATAVALNSCTSNRFDIECAGEGRLQEGGIAAWQTQACGTAESP